MEYCPHGSHRHLGPIFITKKEAGHSDQSDRNGRRLRDVYTTFGGINSDRKPLKTSVLKKLSQLIETPVVHSGVPGNHLNTPSNEQDGHTGISAGYTYFFQLAAHDLVNTVVPFRPDVSANARPRNARRAPLAMETVLGDGPLGCPFAYDTDRGAGRLRTGAVQIGGPGGWVWSEPARDLPRTTFDSSGDYSPRKGLETVLIPDSRNDDNLLLAQLTVLFHGIYNFIVDGLSCSGSLSQDEIVETARLLLVRIYRRIIRHDLLPRVLHPDIFGLYETQGPLALDQASKDGSASIEFAFAAGRMGHSMVREKYTLNKKHTLKLKDIIRISSRHKPKQLPIKQIYLVDWDLFFPPDGATIPTDFNWAIRFGPHVANALKGKEAASTPELGKTGGEPVNGTTFRDLMRENSWPLITVKQLVDHALTNPPTEGWRTILDPVIGEDDRKNIIDKGLGELESQVIYTDHQHLSETERTSIVANPPLSLFFQMEAQQLGRGGITLGPLGSLVIAEAMWPAYAYIPENGEDDLLGEHEDDLLGTRPRTMPQLISVLRLRAPHLFAT